MERRETLAVTGWEGTARFIIWLWLRIAAWTRLWEGARGYTSTARRRRGMRRMLEI